MDVKYINPFLISIKNIFNTMIDVPFQLGKPHVKKEGVPYFEVSGVIGLSGSVVGSVVISLSEQLALQLASALACEEMTELNDDVTDAIGEIANMIAGGAKKEFPGDQNAISTPSVIIGKHRVVYPSDTPIICIPCETSMGRLAVDVAVKEVPIAISA